MREKFVIDNKNHPIAQEYSPVTIIKRIGIVKPLFNFGIQDDQLTHKPSYLVKVKEDENAKTREAFDIQVANAISLHLAKLRLGPGSGLRRRFWRRQRRDCRVSILQGTR